MISILCVNVGNACLAVSVFALLTKNTVKQSRGALTGTYNMFGNIGVMAMSLINATRSEKSSISGIFNIQAGLDIFFAFVLCLTLMRFN